jgi:hypothetical protein
MTFDDDSDDNGKDSRGRGKVLLFPASSILQCIFKWAIRSKNGRIEEGNETSTGLTTETKPRNMTLKWGWLTGQLTRGRVVTHVPPRGREGESGFLSFFFFGARFPFPSWRVDGWNDIMTFVPSTVYPACSGQDGKFLYRCAPPQLHLQINRSEPFDPLHWHHKGFHTVLRTVSDHTHRLVAAVPISYRYRYDQRHDQTGNLTSKTDFLTY